MALLIPVASAEPWDLTTVPFSPRNTPPFTRRGSIRRAKRPSDALAINAATFDRMGLGKRIAQEIPHQPGCSFTGFQRDIPGKSISHNHINPIRWNIPTFDKSDEFNICRIGEVGQLLASGLQLGAAFGFLGPDIQQTDAGAIQSQTVAGIGRAHQRVLGQIVFVSTDVCTHVQHDVKPLWISRRPEAGDGGAIDALQLAKLQHRHCHQRAGIAA